MNISLTFCSMKFGLVLVMEDACCSLEWEPLCLDFFIFYFLFFAERKFRGSAERCFG